MTVTATTKRGQATGQRILDVVRDGYRRRNYGMSYKEIAAAAGVASTSTVGYHVDRLEAAGLLERCPSTPRGVVPAAADRDGTEPVPAPAADSDAADMLVPLDFAGTSGPLLTVAADEHLPDDGVLPGDLCVVNVNGSVTPGDVAGVQIAGRAVVRRVTSEGVRSGDAWLVVDGDVVEVIGPVVTVMRQVAANPPAGG